ncbi:hypothetical protein HIM_06672 [Hirsutella minnesotensis 3608]|uniref:Uncharacterized protein n=1 Tax=Hirsutella minnesotensis 3608 TaxID=1043627 RepID=A0A0F8A4Q8_9HYPO|nr:hypothetical protein HIM_06672 [Hirsutella minnesotensis 3608]
MDPTGSRRGGIKTGTFSTICDPRGFRPGGPARLPGSTSTSGFRRVLEPRARHRASRRDRSPLRMQKRWIFSLSIDLIHGAARSVNVLSHFRAFRPGHNSTRPEDPAPVVLDSPAFPRLGWVVEVPIIAGLDAGRADKADNLIPPPASTTCASARRLGSSMYAHDAPMGHSTLTASAAGLPYLSVGQNPCNAGPFLRRSSSFRHARRRDTLHDAPCRHPSSPRHSPFLLGAQEADPKFPASPFLAKPLRGSTRPPKRGFGNRALARHICCTRPEPATTSFMSSDFVGAISPCELVYWAVGHARTRIDGHRISSKLDATVPHVSRQGGRPTMCF